MVRNDSYFRRENLTIQSDPSSTFECSDLSRSEAEIHCVAQCNLADECGAVMVNVTDEQSPSTCELFDQQINNAHTTAFALGHTIYSKGNVNVTLKVVRSLLFDYLVYRFF